jgi:hypothetical protein
VSQLDLRVVEADGHFRQSSTAVEQVLLAGYTGRDRAAVMEHIHELEKLGVAPPTRIPTVFVVAPELLTSAPSIQVDGPQTSGEAEFFLVPAGDDWLVGVGSDHTDRLHEAIDITASKSMCPKVVSSSVWRYRDVQEHWDQLRLRAWVTTEGEERRLYQDGRLGEFLSLRDLLGELHAAGPADLRGRVVFGGTLPLLGGFAFAPRFAAELYDPLLERTLSCAYNVAVRVLD